MLEQLKRWNLDTGSVEDLVSLHAFGVMVRAHYETLNIETPEWLDAKLRQIKREIVQRNSDENERRLKVFKAQLDNLKTPTERKAEIQKEISRLEKMQVA